MNIARQNSHQTKKFSTKAEIQDFMTTNEFESTIQKRNMASKCVNRMISSISSLLSTHSKPDKRLHEL